MMHTIRAVVRNGHIELLEPVTLVDGAHVLVTLLEDMEHLFWFQASSTALDTVWDHHEDDQYAALLPYNVILVRYPFADRSSSKIRPAVIVSRPHTSQDVFLVPITSRLSGLLPGEFVIQEWHHAGVHVPSAVKRGIYTVTPTIILHQLGQFARTAMQQVDTALMGWLAHAPTIPPPNPSM